VIIMNDKLYESFIEPVPSFFKELVKFLKENFNTMNLEIYRIFVDELYNKYHTGNLVDKELLDIIESCFHISQLELKFRNDEFIKKDSMNILSSWQKMWLNLILNALKEKET